MYLVIGVYLVVFLSAYGYLGWYVLTEFVLTGQLELFYGFLIFIVGALLIFLLQAMVTPLLTPLAWLAEGIWWLIKKAWHGIGDVISHRTQA